METISSPALARVRMASVSAAWPEATASAGRAAFERGDALLEDVGRRVHDAGVDVAELLKPEEAGGVVGVVEDVRRGLVDRHGARLGGGSAFWPAWTARVARCCCFSVFSGMAASLFLSTRCQIIAHKTKRPAID